jgi:sensor histidine kinase regulating citrate/malate metabolism
VRNPGWIPREIQLQLFQRSFSTKGQNRGLGTYSIKLLGEKYLNGEVGFASTQEKGTVFWLWLPELQE